MKKILITISLCIIINVVAAQAQILKPVKWTFTAKKVKAGLYELHMTAMVEKGWKIYSQGTPDGGPLATKISFEKNPLVLLGGKVKELGEMHKVHEEAFGVDVLYYKDKVDFVQVVKLKKPIPTTLSGTVEFMACDTEQCLPPEEIAFKIELK